MGAAADRGSRPSTHAERLELEAALREQDEQRGTVCLPCPDGVDLIPLGRAAEKRPAEVSR